MKEMQMNPLSAIQHPYPYPYYAELTRERPFYFDNKLNLWVASDAASVRVILNAPQMQVRPVAQPVPTGLIGTPAGEVFGQLVRMQDGEYHRQLKSTIIQALSSVDSQYVRALATDITNIQLRQKTDINKLMFLVPASVIAILCGFVPDMVPEILSLIAEFVLCIPPTAGVEQQQRASQAARQLLTFFAKEIEQAKQGTLFSELLQASSDNGWTQHAALISNAIGFLSQTYDATAGLIGNTLLAYRHYSDAFAANVLPSFIKEVSRFDAPIQNTRRFAASSFSHNGQQIDQGQTILLLLAAANRDPASTVHPHEFILGRMQEQSFTFSDGKHRCPGAKIAQDITCGVVDALLKYQPNWADKPYRVRYLPSGNARIPEFIF